MDEEVLDILKKQRDFDREFPDYPCNKCRGKDCKCQGRGCVEWEDWFRKEWGKIRKKFSRPNNM